MGRHRPFWDGAGYGAHCWECRHAHDWEDVPHVDGPSAWCDSRAHVVHKYDSPNNGSSRADGCPWYEYVTPKRRRKK